MASWLQWLTLNIDWLAKLLTTFTLVVGAGFALYRYRVTAPFVPKLELKLCGEIIGNRESRLLLLKSEVKNVGLATAIFAKDGKFLTVQFAKPFSTSTYIGEVQWTPIVDSVHEAFPEELWLEAGETIRTEQLFYLPQSQSLACRAELSLQGNKFFMNLPHIWSVAIIVDLGRSGGALDA